MSFIKELVRFFIPDSASIILKQIGLARRRFKNHADAQMLAKAANFIERHREIISDPLNVAVKRVPNAGYLDSNKNVYLHNGIRVPVAGKFAYYEEFSDILVLNRGVHEPLEEFCFQQLMQNIHVPDDQMVMLELGAYWGHYSMWMKKEIPSSRVIMVEPDKHNIEVGKNNFRLNNLQGEFINEFVSSDDFSVDKFIEHSGISKLHLLHSDIQGFELEMLRDCKNSLSSNLIDYVFVSTHSSAIHEGCLAELMGHEYIIEVTSEPDHHTTSTDGFIFARSPMAKQILSDFNPLGRIEIANSSPTNSLKYLRSVENLIRN